MDFKAFDTSRIDEYTKKAKEQWGKTEVWKEYEEKSKGRTKEDENQLAGEVMQIFAEFGEMKGLNPASEDVQKQVAKLKQLITDNCYTCTNEILSGLGKMYAGGGDFTASIDEVGGEGTAVFVQKAIQVFCGR